MINDVSWSGMVPFHDRSSSLKALFLCSILVSAGPLSSVILDLSPHNAKRSSVSVVLVVRDSAVYCS